MPTSYAPEFSVSYDTTTKVVSGGVCLLFAVIGIGAHDALPVLLGALVIGVAYAYSPRGYSVRERSIFVRRRIGEVRIPMNQVLQARPATSDDFRGCLRLWGNGGLFGYYGLFRTSALGKSTWYMTNRKKAVVVVTGEKTALFSPDDVDGFLAAIRASVPVQDKAPEAVMGTRRRSGAFLLKVAGAGIAGGSVVLVALALRYNPGPPPYTLTAGALTIDDRFYPITIGAASVDVKGVRVVDLDSDPQWRPTVRTNGFANQHYRSGWFRVANGTTVRLYRADGRRLVLLPPKRDDAPVLLEVAEPDRFVDEVRQKWLGR